MIPVHPYVKPIPMHAIPIQFVSPVYLANNDRLTNQVIFVMLQNLSLGSSSTIYRH